MPIYICPHCRNTVIETKVYKKQPNKVKCPYCKMTFDPSEQSTLKEK